MATKLRRICRGAVFALRLVCFALLVLMFSFKLADFLRRPVVSESSIVPASLPAITVCPAALNETAAFRMRDAWEAGLFTTEEVLQAASGRLECNVYICETNSGHTCARPWDGSNCPVFFIHIGGNSPDGDRNAINFNSNGEHVKNENMTDVRNGCLTEAKPNKTKGDDIVPDDTGIISKARNETGGRRIRHRREDFATPPVPTSPSLTPREDLPTPPHRGDPPTSPVVTPREELPSPPDEDGPPPPPERVDLSDRWRSRRIPPGITCHTLDLSDLPEVSSSELKLNLVLNQDFYHPTNGYYSLFFHKQPSPKTWYGGGTIVSTYNLVLESKFRELVLTRTEIMTVDRPERRCEPNADYDFNQVSACHS